MRADITTALTPIRGTAALILSLLAAGCGGSHQEATDLQALEPRRLQGGVVKAPVASAQVEITRFDSRGQAIGPVLATATTTADGTFDIPALPAGVYLARSRNGFYFDESDPAAATNPTAQRRITLTEEQGFEAIIPAGATTLALTPYSQALVNKLRARSQSASIPFSSLIRGGRSLFDQAFGFDVLTTIPANPLSPAGTPEQVNYAMALGGFAVLANKRGAEQNLPQPDYTVILDLIEAISRGQVQDELREKIKLFRNNNNAAYRGLDPVQPGISQIGSTTVATSPVLDFEGDVSAPEGAGTLRFTLVLSSAADTAVGVTVTLEPAGATSGADFGAIVSQASLPAGQTRLSIDVPIVDDDQVEPDESLLLRISNISGADYGNTTQARGTIVDNDVAPTPTPYTHTHAHADPCTHAHANPYTHAHANPYTHADPCTHTHAHADRYAHAHTNAEPDSHTNADADADADPDSHTNAYPYTNAHTHADAHADPYTHANANANADRYAHAHTNAEPDSHTNADPDPDSHTNAHTHADAYTHANANANPRLRQPASPAVGLVYRGRRALGSRGLTRTVYAAGL